MPLPTRCVNSVDIIAFSGRLDASTAPEASEDALGAVEEGSGKLLIDLSGLTFIDSAGLIVLIRAIRAASAKGGNVALLKAPQPVRTLLELTRLDRVFQVFEDETEACAALGGR